VLYIAKYRCKFVIYLLYKSVLKEMDKRFKTTEE